MAKKICIALLLMVAVVSNVPAQSKTLPIPKISLEIGKATNPEDVSVTLQILFLMTVLSLAPALLILTTAFTRIIIVLHFLKQAMGTPQMPPPQILLGLAMFLTFFVMAPVWEKVNTDAIQPYMNKKMSMTDAYDKAVVPLKDFMFKQTREEDLALFVKMSGMNKPATRNDVPLQVLVPSFAISELRIGFQMGFVLFVPFLIIDLVVASILMSMGMMMLPPSMVSLPFKILLFILVDGWHLIIGSLISSFH
jgi:flagellar biosynthesis protein FliP